MRKGDVDILISAQDKASNHLRKIRNETNEVGESFKRVNQGGGISAALDVAGLGQYSGALGTLTDQMGDLISAQEASKEQLTAIKVGAAAAAVAVGVQLGGALMKAVLGYNKFNSEIERSIELQEQATKLAGDRIQRENDKISKLPDPSFERVKALQEQVQRLSKEKLGILPQIEQLRTELENYPNWFTDAGGMLTNGFLPGSVKLTPEERRQRNARAIGAPFGMTKLERKELETKLKTRERLLQLNQEEFLTATKQLELQKEAVRLAQKEYKERIFGGIKDAIPQVKGFIDKVLTGTVEAAKAKQAELLAETEREVSILQKAAERIKEQLGAKTQQLKDEQDREARRRMDALTRSPGAVTAVSSRFLTRGVVQADPVLKENERQTALAKQTNVLTDKLLKVNEKIEENLRITQQLEVVN